jgi:hypothetical protein
MYGGTSYTIPYFDSLEEVVQVATADGAANTNPVSILSSTIVYQTDTDISEVRITSTWYGVEKVYQFKCIPFGIITKIPPVEWVYHTLRFRLYKPPLG